MSFLLLDNEQEANEKINIDDLYERNFKRDLKQLSIFNKILGRIHKRITTTSKNKRLDKYIWFIVPEFIFGEPSFDQSDCIAYIVDKLAENGFYVKYIHPNTLFISWEQWIPSYIRTEIKKKTGKTIDERGSVVSSLNSGNNSKLNDENMDSKLFNMNKYSGGANTNNEEKPEKTGKQFTPIEKYKPTGKLVYNTDLFDKLQEKL
jgi:hypothetical protein